MQTESPNITHETQLSEEQRRTPSRLVTALRWILRVLLPLLIVLLAVGYCQKKVDNKPQPDRRQAPPPKTVVDVLVAKPIDYQVTVDSRGSVQPRTEGTLLAEISGRVMAINSSFRDGGFFTAGDVLLQLDDRDQRANVTIARAELASSRLALTEESTRGKQVRRDFKRLGSSGKATDFALRKPQLASTRAAVEAAKARLTLAELAVERSLVIAPYDGRVREQLVDVGQYVTPATRLAEIYAVDRVEVRLPLGDNQLKYVALPESADDVALPVVFEATVAGRLETWHGEVVRTEGSIDSSTRQRVAIAEVKDPFRRESTGATLKIGQFVTAQVSGSKLPNVVLLPRTAMVTDDESGASVFILGDESALVVKPVTVAWRDGEQVVIDSGLNSGDKVVTTEMSVGSVGSKVQIAGELPAKKSRAENGAPSKNSGSAPDEPVAEPKAKKSAADKGARP